MAYEVVMPYHLHMPSYFLETFTEYPNDKSFHFDTSSYKVRFRAFKFYQVPVPNRPAGHQYVLFRWITVLFPDKSPVL